MARCTQAKRNQAGFTFLEMIIVLAILCILVGIAMPITKHENTRRKEAELKYSLKQTRDAIDRYKIDCELGLVGLLDRRVNDNCYPPDLDRLVEGINIPNSDKTIRYLRSIPVDPFTENTEWGLRSDQDDRDSTSWGNENVYDIYSKSERVALNGTRYKDW